MTFARRATFTFCLPLVGALVQLSAGEVQTPAVSPTVRYHTPNLELDQDGSVIASRGFVVEIGDKLLIGDALRYHLKHDDLYATGKVVLVMPGVRLHAARLGLHPKAETGEAWEIEAFVEHAGRRITITADHVYLDRTQLRFDGIRGIAGHGGLLGMGASSARVYLRDKPAEDRSGFERQVEGIELIGPTVRAAGIPVFWFPYLYRDFYYDYPWTRYEGGKTRRLGYYARAWIGTSLRSIYDWHPSVEARGDMYSRTGEAWGLRGAWRHPRYGKGQVSWFDIPNEIVMGGPDDLQNIAERHASVFDAEQQLHGLGGALYARWAELPDKDPTYPGDPELPWDDRFRADYLRNDLEHRPFARQGITGTWGTSLGTITLDTERRANPEQPLTERLWGVQVQLPRLQLTGPLHVGGNGWSESLENDTTGDSAVRTSFSGIAAAMQWFGPLGIDLSGGVNGLAYQDGEIANVEVDNDEARLVPVIASGIRTRFIGDWGNGLSHTFTPRIGVELYQEGEGDVLSAWNFGDPRDRLEEDLHLMTTGFDTSISGTRALFRANLTARWAMREEDREFINLEGNPDTANSSLYDVIGSFEGSPIATVVLNGNFTYDGQREAWRFFDFGSSWVATRWLLLRYSGALIPETTVDDEEWQHRPGLTFIGNRYRMDGDVTFRPGGDVIDQWTAQLTRRMVDGDLTFTYEIVRDEDGHIYDRRFGVSFSMTVGGAADHQPGTSASSGFMGR